MYIDPIANYLAKQREEAATLINRYYASIRAKQEERVAQIAATQVNQEAPDSFEDFDF